MDKEKIKIQAAQYTVDHFIESGMIVGLGSGSTSLRAVQRLGERLKSGELKDIIGIPASRWIEDAARELNIPLATLDEQPLIDLTFDGADEVDPQLNLIKGGGGSLLREKIVAQASQREIIMVDSSKLVPVLGTSWAVPIEVTTFGMGAHRRFLELLGGTPILRTIDDGSPFITDQGNYILDTQFGTIDDPYVLNDKLNAFAGIVEHGLFLDVAASVVVADENGVRVMER